MKLLFVHERLGALAGAEANVHLTASELKHRGHDVGLLHGPATGRDDAAWREAFSDCFLLDGRSGVAAVQSALRSFGPDVIYVHKMSDLEVLAALSESGVPVVRMVHDHALYCMRGYKYHYFSREICDRAASLYCLFPCGAFVARNHAGPIPFQWVSYTAKQKEIGLNRRFHRMIVATDYMKEELVRNGFNTDRIEIHAPVPRPAEAALRSSFSERNRIIYAGQIIRGKGVDVLLESLALVKLPFECIVLGDGNHRPYCEQLSRRLGLTGRVHFQGFVPQEEIKTYYRECTVVALSSVWPEPFGAVGLEGMRYGLPVVAFDAGGIKEWLIDGGNGYLVPWMDRARFAARVEELLRDKELARRMGERGRQWASERYDFSKYISGLEDLFVRVRSERTSLAAA